VETAAHPRRSQPIAFKEEEMANGKRTRADAETGQTGADPASAMTRSAEAWLESQADLLHEVDALTHAWVQRRRETIEEMRQSIEEMRNSREPTDMLRIQQEWLTGSLRRVASDRHGPRWQELCGRRLCCGSLKRVGAVRRRRSASGSNASGSGEASVLSTAGSKPRGRRSAGGGR
jgi:hypothetical protein